MKFLKTIDGLLINIDEISYIESELEGKSWYTYIYLKSNEKRIYFLEHVHCFNLDDETEYLFDKDCVDMLTTFFIEEIFYNLSFSECYVVSVDETDETVWNKFTDWATRNIYGLFAIKTSSLHQ